MKELKSAQHYFESRNGSFLSGANAFIQGLGHPTRTDYVDGYSAACHGYEAAEDLAKLGKLAFIRRFKCDWEKCRPFSYGGFFVCNECGRKGVDKPWWRIIVEPDGNEFCCHGLDFEDLQSSDNYAFGNTFEEAIKNYGDVMRLKEVL